MFYDCSVVHNISFLKISWIHYLASVLLCYYFTSTTISLDISVLVSFNFRSPEQSKERYTVSFYWTLLLFVDLRRYSSCYLNYFTIATGSVDIIICPKNKAINTNLILISLSLHFLKLILLQWPPPCTLHLKLLVVILFAQILLSWFLFSVYYFT